MIEYLVPVGFFYILFGKKSKSGLPNKYIPKDQPNFTSKLKPILKNLEKDLKAPGLYDFFIGVKYIESKGFPSAIRYEKTGYKQLFLDWKDPKKRRFKKRFENNKWRTKPYLWNYTGGLFQIFPGTALYAADQTPKNNDPRTVFNPYYNIAYSIDYASRLNKSHGADNWVKVRYGWNSLGTLKFYDGKMEKEAERVRNKIHNAIEKTGGDPDILYDYQPNLFSYYRQNYGFDKVLKLIKGYNI